MPGSVLPKRLLTLPDAVTAAAGASLRRLELSGLLYFRKLAFPAALAVLMTILAAGCSNSGPQAVEVAVSLQDNALTPGTIRVGQGDTVTLKIEGDAPGSLHLHGYDLEENITPGEIAVFAFVADATGRYRIAFHPAAEGGEGHPGEPASSIATGSMAAGSMSHDSTAQMGTSHDSGGGMNHDAAVSESPVSVAITAEPDDQGGVNIQIMTEGWRWAPEEVNQSNSPGAGHAHVYVDGVKINRVYGPHYYLMGMEPGTREIRVALNNNGHSEIVFDGQTVEDTATVTVAGHGNTGHGDADAVDAAAAMSVKVMAHPDAVDGYNLQVMPSGFEFAPQNVDGGHVPGQGAGYVSIDGQTHARLYSPWIKLVALEPGMHEIAVSLVNNAGAPYRWQASPVEATVMVHVEDAEPSGEMGTGGHHGEQTQMEHGSTGETDASAEETAPAGEEIDVGYLEVQPR